MKVAHIMRSNAQSFTEALRKKQKEIADSIDEARQAKLTLEADITTSEAFKFFMDEASGILVVLQDTLIDLAETAQKGDYASSVASSTTFHVLDIANMANTNLQKHFLTLDYDGVDTLQFEMTDATGDVFYRIDNTGKWHYVERYDPMTQVLNGDYSENTLKADFMKNWPTYRDELQKLFADIMDTANL